METVSKIRRWVLADAVSIREASRRTGVSRTTIRKYLRDENVEPHYRLSSPRPCRRLLDYEALLKEMFDADLQRAPRERRSMQGLYEALVTNGFEASYDTVRRYIVRHKSKRGSVKGYVPLEFDAGDALQFDWGHEIVSLGLRPCFRTV